MKKCPRFCSILLDHGLGLFETNDHKDRQLFHKKIFTYIHFEFILNVKYNHLYTFGY